MMDARTSDIGSPVAEELAAALLSGLDIASVVQCRAALPGTWSLEFVADDCAVFHIVHEGSAWLRVPGEPALVLGTGDVVLVAPGRSHRIGHGDPGVPLWTGHVRADAADGCENWDSGRGGAVSEIVCGGFRFRDPSLLIERVPASIVVSARAPDTPFLAGVVDLIAMEARRPAAGVVLRRLADVLFVSIVRAWLGGAGGRSGATSTWARVASDARISSAVVAIHSDPARNWTLAELARHVGMSRSSLADCFRTTVGTPPGEYVTAVRMQRARAMLHGRDASVAEVAASVGYASEAAFSRAFKRTTGVPPSRIRSQ
jgi:AraC-like DNA-binding protein